MNPDGETRALTSGEWVVDELAGLSEDGGTVYFEGWMASPLERHLYAVPFDGGEPVQITQGEGRWSASLGQGGTGFIGSYSDPDTLPQTALYDISGERVAWIEENAIGEDHPYAPFLESHLVSRVRHGAR